MYNELYKSKAPEIKNQVAVENDDIKTINAQIALDTYGLNFHLSKTGIIIIPPPSPNVPDITPAINASVVCSLTV